VSDQPQKILVVEDDSFFRGLLVRQLNEEGYTSVKAAQDGYQALHLLRKDDIDLVLLDIEMPGLGGIEVLKRLKADAGLRNIPVIVISGVEEITSVVQCIELGAEDYLTKPFNPVILRARIGASLEKRRLRKLEASHLAQILQEQKKSDELLNVVLPAAAARELKATGVVAPHRHDCVAVLFCDIVGFTAYCDKHAAEDVVSRLQALIERFEEITEQHRMEKIKTIGDAFMATAGMLIPNSNPLASATRCGLDMILAAGEVTRDWQVRVGVNCGPMISGVLGRRRYQFDAWGSAINVAARMTALASPGTVAMTRDASLHLGSAFVTRPLGRKEVKGLGFMELFECYGIAVQQC